MFVACPPDKAGWPHTYPGQWVIHQWEPRNLPKYHDTHVSSSFCHFTRLFLYLNFCWRLPHNSLLSLTRCVRNASFFLDFLVLWSPGAIERVGDSCGHKSHPRLSIGVKWLRSKFLEPSNLDESNIRPRIPHPTSDPSVSSKGWSGAARMWNLTLVILVVRPIHNWWFLTLSTY